MKAKPGQLVEILGFQRTTNRTVHMQGVIQMQRPGEPTWIIELPKNHVPPQIAGAAVYDSNKELIGIVTHESMIGHAKARQVHFIDFLPIDPEHAHSRAQRHFEEIERRREWRRKGIQPVI